MNTTQKNIFPFRFNFVLKYRTHTIAYKINIQQNLCIMGHTFNACDKFDQIKKKKKKKKKQKQKRKTKQEEEEEEGGWKEKEKKRYGWRDSSTKHGLISVEVSLKWRMTSRVR